MNKYEKMFLILSFVLALFSFLFSMSFLMQEDTFESYNCNVASDENGVLMNDEPV